jgi:hypothetical protein
MQDKERKKIPGFNETKSVFLDGVSSRSTIYVTQTSNHISFREIARALYFHLDSYMAYASETPGFFLLC